MSENGRPAGYFDAPPTPAEALERLRRYVAELDADQRLTNVHRNRLIAGEVRDVLELTEMAAS